MWRDVAGAFAFLTVFPLDLDFSSRKPGWIFSYFPLVGLFIGGCLYGLARLLTLSPSMEAWLILLVWVVLTGGLHLDGLGDSCDGLLAVAAPERRLEIMKDPRTGSWGVIGLCLLLLGKWAALSEADPRDVLLCPIMGRWAMVLAAKFFGYARPSGSGTGRYFRQGLGWPQVLGASALAIASALLINPLVVLVPPLIVLVIGKWAARRLGGGLTGDAYGALCELTELACLWISV
jgi:adenosylcobinamide-GDP ribazoletransferase